jgi:hypothetical protein
LLFGLSTLLNAQINYYVTSGGDNANDGLTQANAFADVATAFTAAQTSFDADNSNNSYIFNIGTGTFTAALSFTNSSTEVSFSFVGNGADNTIFDGGSARFANIGDTQDNLKFTFSNLTLNNYENTWAGGMFNLNGTDRTGIEVSFDNCKLSNFSAQQGPIIFSKSDTKVSITNSYIYNVTTKANGWIGGGIEMQDGELVIENCIFEEALIDRNSKSQDRVTASVAHIESTQGAITARIINNTFVNNQLINNTTAYLNSVIYINGTTNAITATVANNIIIGNTTTNPLEYDVLVENNGVEPTLTNCTNNILNIQSAFTETGNTINAALTYTSTEVAIIMNINDATAFDYDTTTTGVPYIKAEGTSVIGGALAIEQTVTDISGTIRSNPGSIGAYEYVDPNAKTPQFITFADFTDVLYSQASAITLEDVASSGLTITYLSSDESVATISGNAVTPVGAGTVTITASQAGDDTYEAAPVVMQDLYLAPDTLTYYVRASGDNSNDGLTEENALVTLAATASAASNDNLSIAYQIDIAGEFTDNTSASFNFNRDENIHVLIKGDGAATTIYKLKSDADYDYVLEASSRSAGRMFASPKNIGAGNLNIDIEDMTFRNFGFTNDNGGGLFNINTSGVTVDVTMTRCNIERGVARSGALVQANNGTVTFTMDACYVSDILAVNKTLYNAGIYITKSCSFTAKNTIFAHCKKGADMFGTADLDATNTGTVITFEPTDATASLTLINNTFIADSMLRNEMEVAQSTVAINDAAGATVTIANNLFIGSYSATTTQDYYNVSVTGSPVLTNCTHNVMLAQSGLGETDNSINAAYTLTSPEIDFMMDGVGVDSDTTTTGIVYVTPMGSDIVEQGLASVSPEYDILHKTRHISTPSVGAVEVFKVLPTVMSSVYNIDQASSTISGVPDNELLTDFEANLTLTEGTGFDTYESDGTTVATDLMNGYLVLATGGVPANQVRTYNVIILSNDASITSTTYTVDETAKTITNVAYATTLADFEANLTPATGATFVTYEANGLTEATDVQTGYIVTVTAENGVTTANYTIQLNSASDAYITSAIYTVDETAKTITNVAYATTLADFEANLTPATGATFVTYEADGLTEATDVQTGYIVTVTAENGVTTANYTIQLNSASDAYITSAIYTVDETAKTITNVAYATTLADFEANLTPATGASFVTYQADETTEATDILSNYKVIVIAEDGVSTSTYTVTVETGNGINDLTNNIINIYPNPCVDEITINEESINRVVIYNMNGKQVLNTEMVNSTINVSNLSQGIYTVICRDISENIIGVQKLVKK